MNIKNLINEEQGIMLKYICLVITLIGFAVFVYSKTLAPYTDYEAFDKEYQKMNPFRANDNSLPAIESLHDCVIKNGGEYNQHCLNEFEKTAPKHNEFPSVKTYRELRSKYLTNKYLYENTGIILMLFGVFFAYILKDGLANIRALDKNWKYFALGVTASSLSAFGFSANIMINLARGSNPWWADSFFIAPIISLIAFPILIAWVFIIMRVTKSNFTFGASINDMGYKDHHLGFIVLCAATLYILVSRTLQGNFLIALASLLWLYFYLSLMAGKKLDTY